MNEILQFTDAAAEHIKKMIQKDQGLGFRVTVEKTGCSGFKYAPSIISQEVSGDLQFKLKNDLNVYLDPLCLEYLKGLVVDFVEEQREGRLKQMKLVFINPNEKSRCGCGESFHV